MKTKQNLNTFTALLLLFVLWACSSNEKPEIQLLRQVMEQHANKILGEGAYSDSIANDVLFFKQKTNKQKILLTGTCQIQGDYRAVYIIDEIMTNTSDLTGVFKQDDSGWKSLFEQNLVEGKLDTIIDLNGDHIDEVIVKTYYERDFGEESKSYLYSNLGKSFYEKADSIADGYGTRSSAKYSTINYVPVQNTGQILIIVDTEESTFSFSEKPSNHKYSSTYRWQPPNLIKVPSGSSDQSITKTDPAQAQSELDKLTDGFESIKDGLLLSYKSEFSIGGSSAQYYFDKNYGLKYRNTSDAGEGGYLEEYLIEYESDKVIRSLKTLQGNSDFKGFYFYQNGQLVLANVRTETYTKDGKGYYRYKINNDESSQIDHEGQPKQPDTQGMTDNFDPANDLHMKAVSENAARFALVEGRYECYVRRDTLQNSETGEKEISYEVYHVDRALFEELFLKKKP